VAAVSVGDYVALYTMKNHAVMADFLLPNSGGFRMVTLVTLVAAICMGLTLLTGNRAASLVSQNHATKYFHKAKEHRIQLACQLEQLLSYFTGGTSLSL